MTYPRVFIVDRVTMDMFIAMDVIFGTACVSEEYIRWPFSVKWVCSLIHNHWEKARQNQTWSTHTELTQTKARRP